MRAREEWTTLGSTGVHSLRAGAAGPAVVLVPGFVVGVSYLRPLLAEVSTFARAYAVDLPGHGRSDAPPVPHGVQDQARTLAAWLEERVGEPAVLVPNSLGAHVVVELAVDRPDLVRGLVLLGPSTDSAARTVRAQAGRLVRDFVRERPSLLVWEALGLWRADLRTQLRELRTALAQPEEELLRRVSAPALVVRGGRDTIVPQEWAVRVADLLPHGRLAVLPGRAHAVNHNAPVETGRLVHRFVRELES